MGGGVKISCVCVGVGGGSLQNSRKNKRLPRIYFEPESNESQPWILSFEAITDHNSKIFQEPNTTLILNSPIYLLK